MSVHKITPARIVPLAGLPQIGPSVLHRLRAALQTWRPFLAHDEAGGAGLERLLQAARADMRG
ncbi:MAG: hypothetical protein CML68_10440 [Rhodobacteraceae bacterium]|nr:hypothetical protein [Paracoccaceae bacterium]